jgi:hypothetical protein
VPNEWLDARFHAKLKISNLTIMDSLIRLGLKGLKLLFGVCIVIGLFFLIVTVAIISVPFFATEHYEADERPSSMFRVVLETYDESLGQSRFHCERWEDFQQMRRNEYHEYVSKTELTCGESTSVYETVYSAELSLPEGSCTNISSDFRVENTADNTQVVKLKMAQEAYRGNHRYRVVNQTVIPLNSCTFMSSGICVSIFFVSLILLPTIVILFRYFKKRFGNLFATGLAFTLVGLCALNYAVFNLRMGLDRFSDNSQNFIAASWFALMAAVVFFLGALVCLWIRKKNKLPDGAPV